MQNGDFEGFRQQLPPRDYFTDEIRRQLSANFGEGEFLGGGMTVRATYDPELQAEATAALRDALETDLSYAQKIFNFSGKTLLVDEAMMNAVTAVSGSGPAITLTRRSGRRDPMSRVRAIATSFAFGDLTNLQQGVEF